MELQRELRGKLQRGGLRWKEHCTGHIRRRPPPATSTGSTILSYKNEMAKLMPCLKSKTSLLPTARSEMLPTCANKNILNKIETTGTKGTPGQEKRGASTGT
jgi:hypothetical protein